MQPAQCPGGEPDPGTSAEIVTILTDYINCLSTGEYPLIYAFYSDQALRDDESIRDLIAKSWDAGNALVS